MPNIDVNIEPLKKELRGIVYQTVNEEMKKFNAQETLVKLAKQFLKKHSDKMIKSHVYKYLEEAQIDLNPHAWKSNKITLNNFIIQVVRETVENKVRDIIMNRIKIDFSIDNQKEDKK